MSLILEGFIPQQMKSSGKWAAGDRLENGNQNRDGGW